MNLLLEELPSLVVFARPAPKILAVAVCFCAMEDAGANGPHHVAEHEETDGEDGIVNCCLLCSLVTSFPVGPEDEYRECKRDARDDE